MRTARFATSRESKAVCITSRRLRASVGRDTTPINRRLAVAFSVAAALLAQAAVADILLVPQQYRSVQAAIDVAVDGDEIQVSPGTYGPIAFYGKSISIVGVGDGARVIAAEGVGSAGVIDGPLDEPGGAIVVSGMTFTGGVGVDLFRNGTLIGGGLIVRGDVQLTLLDCTFTQNAAEYGGGLAVGSGVSAHVERCVFVDNGVTFGGGGAIVFDNQSADFIECEFVDNQSGLQGGGLDLNNAAVATVTDCLFVGNRLVPESIVIGSGGGMVVLFDAIATVTSSRFEDNEGTSGGALGIATSAQGPLPTVLVTACEFVGNVAGSSGGAVQVALPPVQPPVFIDCLFEGNSAPRGGGASVQGSATFESCEFIANLATTGFGEGGGITILGTSATVMLENCTLESNEALFGGGINVGPATTLLMVDSTVNGNTASVEGGGVRIAAAATASIEGSTLCDNAPEDVLGPWTDLGGNDLECVPPVFGDLDGDGVVDGADLGLLLNAWGACRDPRTCPADLDGDGVVDGADLGLLLNAWG